MSIAVLHSSSYQSYFLVACLYLRVFLRTSRNSISEIFPSAIWRLSITSFPSLCFSFRYLSRFSSACCFLSQIFCVSYIFNSLFASWQRNLNTTSWWSESQFALLKNLICVMLEALLLTGFSVSLTAMCICVYMYFLWKNWAHHHMFLLVTKSKSIVVWFLMQVFSIMVDRWSLIFFFYFCIHFLRQF